MDRFIGNIDAKLDVKGRVFIPAAFRKILQASGDTRLILRKDVYQKCLVLYPGNIWEEELIELRSRLNKYNEEQQQIFRQFVMGAELLEMDSSGRILIPKRYLQMANISSDVRFIGMDHTIEIWSRMPSGKLPFEEEDFKENFSKHLGL
ncbi:MAG: division/cell wall cluster transcriptional repressor MraZ [Candidatus Azobacteroides sp.]|nr:division/cell wall cluster transcriptional repressor MraZ [Candidatus Azobacteroides sp.]